MAKLPSDVQAYQDACLTYSKVAEKLFHVLKNDALHADDELLDAYKQARDNLKKTLETLIDRQERSRSR